MTSMEKIKDYEIEFEVPDDKYGKNQRLRNRVL